MYLPHQLIALVVRGIAVDQITPENVPYLWRKEVGISLINGLLWGAAIGLIAALLYQNPMLGVVLASATLLNLVVAALSGVAVPLGLRRLGRDPALGSSVLLTFITDSMGFFIFLGLAALVLVA